MTRAASFVDGEVRYLDDMREGNMLAIRLDDQGDVYIAIRPEGHRMGPSVRLCASGGADHVTGLLPAMRAAFAAIKTATDGGPQPATMSREQGIEACAIAASAEQWTSLLLEWRALRIGDAASALNGTLTHGAWFQADWDRFRAAVLTEARRLVAAGKHPALAGCEALK